MRKDGKIESLWSCGENIKLVMGTVETKNGNLEAPLLIVFGRYFRLWLRTEIGTRESKLVFAGLEAVSLIQHFILCFPVTALHIFIQESLEKIPTLFIPTVTSIL